MTGETFIKQNRQSGNMGKQGKMGGRSDVKDERVTRLFRPERHEYLLPVVGLELYIMRVREHLLENLEEHPEIRRKYFLSARKLALAHLAELALAGTTTYLLTQ